MINSPQEKTITKFFTEIQKTASCRICHHLLKDAVFTRCGHQFCRPCFNSSNTSEKKCCPLCKGAVSKRAILDNAKMKNIFSSLHSFVRDLSEESGVKPGIFGNVNHNENGTLKSQPPAKTEQPRKLSRGKKSLTIRTPEANLKVKEWLSNVDPSINNNTDRETDDDRATPIMDKDAELNDNKVKRKTFFPSRASQSAASTQAKTIGLKRGRARKSLEISKAEISIGQLSDTASEANIEDIQNDPYDLIADKTTNSTRSRSRKSADNLTQNSNSRKEPLKFCSPTDGSKKIGQPSSDGSKTTEPLILASKTDSQRSVKENSIQTTSADAENTQTSAPKRGRPKRSIESSKAETSISRPSPTVPEINIENIENDPGDSLPAKSTGSTHSTRSIKSTGNPTPTSSSTKEASKSSSPVDGVKQIGDPSSSDGYKATEPSTLPSRTHSRRSAVGDPIETPYVDPKTINTGVRLTFSVESETQDLLELGAPLKATDYTQNQFEMSAVKRKVSFRRIGLLSLNRAALHRRPIVFKQLGKLEAVSSPGCVPLVDISNSSVKKHSSAQTLPTASRSSSTQTETKSHRCVETQTEAGELSVSTTSESLALNSMDFLQPTNPSVPVKRSRETAMDVDAEESSNNKRQRGIPDAHQADCVPPKTSTANETVGSVTPSKTRVPESDSESDDIFLATPESQKHLSKIAEAANKPKVFICSGLPRSQIKSVEELARQHGTEVLAAYNESVTHVIVRVDEERSAERTLKFLYGVAACKWIVSIDWVTQCLKEKRYVKEEPYEVLDMDGENGPWRARQSTKLLFNDFEFCCVEPFTDVTAQQLRQLLELCGASTVDHPAGLTKSCRFSLIVMQADTVADQRKADVYNDRYKVVSVSREWVLDCIASYQLYPLRTQIIGRVDSAALTKMGFTPLLD